MRYEIMLCEEVRRVANVSPHLTLVPQADIVIGHRIPFLLVQAHSQNPFLGYTRG